MNRYVIKFSKEGTLRYISHLDLLRLFKRSFKRVGIKLQHTQGFNPHPKMSFAQPLSLGYCSTAEYLEFETAEPYQTNEILEKISSVMPEGISVLSCKELPSEGKSLAALTSYADYEIKIPIDPAFQDDFRETIKNYYSQDQIFVTKHQKKSGKDLEVDIKPMISALGRNRLGDDKYITLTMKIAAGSAENLSPELVLSSFCEFAGFQYDREDVMICRTGIYFSN